MALVNADIAKIVADSVPAIVAAQIDDVERKVAETRKKDKETDWERFNRLVEETRQAAQPTDPWLYVDRHKGKGLGFIRAALCQAEAQLEGHARVSPLDIAHKRSKDKPGYKSAVEFLEAQRSVARGVSASDFLSAGALLTTAVGEIIELLYANTVIDKAGARRVNFPGSLKMGRLNAGATASYVGETQAIPASKPQTGELLLKSRKISALVGISNEMLRHSDVSIEALIRDDLIMAAALKRDAGILRGSGSEAQPKGIDSQMIAANKVPQSGVTLAAVVADLVKVISRVATSNVPMVSPAWFMNPRSFWFMMGLLDSNNQFTFMNQLSQGKLFGFNVYQTTQIPINLSGTQSEIYFLDANDLIDGTDTNTPLQSEFFPNSTFIDETQTLVSGISTDQSCMRLLMAHDSVLRHDNTAAMLTGVTYGV